MQAPTSVVKRSSKEGNKLFNGELSKRCRCPHCNLTAENLKYYMQLLPIGPHSFRGHKSCPVYQPFEFQILLLILGYQRQLI